jgi:hypothetical protein
MRNASVALLAFAIALVNVSVPAFAEKKPKLDDFPTKFLVRSATMPSEGGDTCQMELEAGNMHYSVSQKSYALRWKFCTTFTPGQEIHGRYVGKGNYIEILSLCCQSFKNQQGKWKTEKWNVDHSYTVQ